MLRSGANSNVYRYGAGRAGDKHYLSLAASVADSMSGRGAQRLAALCLLALFDPSYTIPVEMVSGSAVRSTPLRTQIDAMARQYAVMQPEVTTKAQRQAVAGWMGRPSGVFDSQKIDSTFTGYWMYAVELWHLVNAGASYLDSYPIGAW